MKREASGLRRIAVERRMFYAEWSFLSTLDFIQRSVGKTYRCLVYSGFRTVKFAYIA
ncbi:hypothetical protein PghCCS26_58370 [Paenibacillus glycanilyticus]|uniref:Uncharacterized protein n=1 Tax=Paenibacillus glycanilyticus TaxID=126569 RepID=A0ABQ6NX48_9BACL|nr:hypothetical protein PghCCS26_58370 [Paenibacillus glycanilyticus]